MIMTKIEIEEFDKASKPLIEYLAKNHHPHMTVIVTSDSSEIMEGKRRFKTDEFIQ
jgi:alkaline phosphatase